MFEQKEDSAEDYSIFSLRYLDSKKLKERLFNAIRSNKVDAIKNILQIDKGLLTQKMYGYEGTDVYERIPNSRTKRCYTYTGDEKSGGYFYPIHVAAEYGHKMLVFSIIKAGASVTEADYKGETAEQRANGEAIHAFYELNGLRKEAIERYEGGKDRFGVREGEGAVYFKPEGYKAKESLVYRGRFKAGLYHGSGTLYWPGTDVVKYVGRFLGGKMHGRGSEFDETGDLVFQGTFRNNCREGKGVEYKQGLKVFEGEMCGNKRQGFGCEYVQADGHFYLGHFEENLWNGVGIYVNILEGCRAEGYWYNNKQDGIGSLYIIDRNTYLATSGKHGLWNQGKNTQENQQAFVPGPMDLPHTVLKDNECGDEIDDVYEHVHDAGGAAVSSSGQAAADFSCMIPSQADKNVGKPVSVSPTWKLVLALYCKMSVSVCQKIGLTSAEIATYSHRNGGFQNESSGIGGNNGGAGSGEVASDWTIGTDMGLDDVTESQVRE